MSLNTVLQCARSSQFTHTATWIVVFQLAGTSVFLFCCVAEVSSSENRVVFGVKPCRQRQAGKVCGVGLVMLRLFAASKKQQEAAEMAQNLVLCVRDSITPPALASGLEARCPESCEGLPQQLCRVLVKTRVPVLASLTFQVSSH